MPLPSHGPSPSSPPRPTRRHVSTLDAEFQTAPLPRAPARRNASPARRIAPPRPAPASTQRMPRTRSTVCTDADAVR
ncbi:uncharacterized protein TRAVEDRAFT_50483 [Trametes versicolor FP-101664 SS1]|uniref:uncharacterized protein n=1 Tax=Trametes versicolor (strain FP-101664) TaxID=717944 RepID=UPI0004623CA1|nr:uncharacterized protein TRAVEDRAFT_50483 [Trametes versicolor FP-101664 SS1]EIW55992.1 hypothetical protein TRAVEDRAFT_50483 [Trametes versicolor FP-101664 SS1]